jgi:ankyrin repeat protein
MDSKVIDQTCGQTMLFLLKEGVDEDINIRNKDGTTPLMYAANSGYEEVVDILLKKGADVNIEGNNGMTALIYAVTASNELQWQAHVCNRRSPNCQN